MYDKIITFRDLDGSNITCRATEIICVALPSMLEPKQGVVPRVFLYGVVVVVDHYVAVKVIEELKACQQMN